MLRVVSQHDILQSILRIGFHALGLFTKFVVKNPAPFLFSFIPVHHLTQFLCTFFLLSPIDKGWSQVFLWLFV
jgi:hypothetical protein